MARKNSQSECSWKMCKRMKQHPRPSYHPYIPWQFSPPVAHVFLLQKNPDEAEAFNEFIFFAEILLVTLCTHVSRVKQAKKDLAAGLHEGSTRFFFSKGLGDVVVVVLLCAFWSMYVETLTAGYPFFCLRDLCFLYVEAVTWVLAINPPKVSIDPVDDGLPFFFGIWLFHSTGAWPGPSGNTLCNRYLHLGWTEVSYVLLLLNFTRQPWQHNPTTLEITQCSQTRPLKIAFALPK